jgi:hypothetical protein
MGDIKITGTIGNLTFYKMDAIYYVRKKSSLDRHKVMKSPKFARTMTNATEFGMASPIASSVYGTFSKEQKGRKIFNAMVGRANHLLHIGRTEAEVRETLVREFKPVEVNDEWSMVNNAKLKMKNVKGYLKTPPAPYGALLEEILKLRECLAPYSASNDLQI